MATTAKWKRHLSASDRRAKVVIEACVLSGAGIEYLPDAPRFRYEPITKTLTSFEPPRAHQWDRSGDCKPSGRGSVSFGPNKLKLKNWTPTKLSLAPQYEQPMKGDDPELTRARKAWASGDPKPLRAYLTKQAAERRTKAQAQRPPEQMELAA